MSEIGNLYRKILVAVAAVTLAAMSSVIGSTAASAATPMSSVTGSHTCANFGGERRGYQAGQCADLYITDGDSGTVVESQGQSFCQTVVAPRETVQCSGIEQIVKVVWVNPATGANSSAMSVAKCGSFNTAVSCPTGGASFLNYSPITHEQCRVGEEYFATVQTDLVLPVSGAVEVSSELSTHGFVLC